jgi:hypothetical protein
MAGRLETPTRRQKNSFGEKKRPARNACNYVIQRRNPTLSANLRTHPMQRKLFQRKRTPLLVAVVAKNLQSPKLAFLDFQNILVE